MKSYIALIEIPALDIHRAINFYQSLLDIRIESFEMPGVLMGVLPYENQMVTIVIVQGEDYQPSEKGCIVYFNAGEDLQVVLDKVEPGGGKVLIPKTKHGDESGYFAVFLDCEGNRIGLHSRG